MTFLSKSLEVKMHNNGSSGMPIAIRWCLVVLKDFSLTMAIIFANLYLIQPVLTSEELYEHY